MSLFTESQAEPVQDRRGTSGPAVVDLIVADLARENLPNRGLISDFMHRKALGVQHYGTPLRVNNGRDALIDLYQELLDAVIYARQASEGSALVSPRHPISSASYGALMTLVTVLRTQLEQDYR